jgi:hypothetical protein
VYLVAGDCCEAASCGDCDVVPCGSRRHPTARTCCQCCCGWQMQPLWAARRTSHMDQYAITVPGSMNERMKQCVRHICTCHAYTRTSWCHRSAAADAVLCISMLTEHHKQHGVSASRKLASDRKLVVCARSLRLPSLLPQPCRQCCELRAASEPAADPRQLLVSAMCGVWCSVAAPNHPPSSCSRSGA